MDVSLNGVGAPRVDTHVVSDQTQACVDLARELSERINDAQAVASAIRVLDRKPDLSDHERQQLLSLRREASGLLNSLETLLADTDTDTDARESAAGNLHQHSFPLPGLKLRIPLCSFTASKKPLRLLLVDDRRINQLILADEFSSHGQVVVVADTGLKALELLREQTFDAVLTDTNMPHMNGLELAKAIRELEGPAAGLPIILLVPEESPANLEKARTAGASAIARKHAGPEHILSILAGHLPSDMPLRGYMPAGGLSLTVH